jgi:glycosyltransferase involved in cell wall biosynthesis
LIGGIGRHTYLMYSELKGADFLFFSPAKNQLERHVRIDFWPVRFIKQVGVSIWLHLNARGVIVRHGLDKLNIHTGPGGVLLARRLPVPVIVTCHHTYRQQCRHLRSQFWKRIFIPFEKRTYRLATRIVAVSEATRRALIEDYQVPQEKISTVYNAVETDPPRPAGADKGGHTVLYVGRIAARKGIEFLIRSIPLVRERIPDVQLLVAGKGAQLERLQTLARRLDLEANVRFLGFVPDEELSALYSQAQCAVVPSRFEGFGITVIEALAAGIRVVGTDVDGIREILAGGEYGTLAPYGDRSALAEAIVSELQNPRTPPQILPRYRIDQFRSGYLDILQSR